MNSIKQIMVPIGFAVATVVSMTTFGYIMDDICKTNSTALQKKYILNQEELKEIKKENEELRERVKEFMDTRVTKL